MNYNLPQMQENIRAEFETMLQFVTSEEAQTATADQIERNLFQLLLNLGGQLLLLFFQMRSQACSRDKMIVNGQTIGYHSEQKRVYFSIFGKVPIWRPYFYNAKNAKDAKKGGYTPLDGELSLGTGRHSDLLRETLNYLAVYIPFNKAVGLFKRILKVGISTRVQKQLVAEDAVDVLAYYEQKAAPAVEEEADILVIQADGKGVPIIVEKDDKEKPAPVRLGKGQKRGRKKEAIVTAVYTINGNVRTPKEVVDSFFQPDKGSQKEKIGVPKPKNKRIWATLDGKAVALARLEQQVTRREGSHIVHKVALADGCEALQSRIETQFPEYTLILDFVHANEYLWKVSNALHGEGNERRTAWVKKQTEQMLSGKTQQLIDDLRSSAKKKSRTKRQVETLEKTANYFERNLKYMAYDTYLAKGWPIASGVIEGACRHFVKDRFELSGMRWKQSGAENLLRLRAVAENGDWDDYYLFHRQQRHQRLYTCPFPSQNALEQLALQPTTSIAPSENSVASESESLSHSMVEQKSGVFNNVTQTPFTNYHALPLRYVR